MFAKLLGPATSTVRRQPSISELVENARKKSNMNRDRTISGEKKDTAQPGNNSRGLVSDCSDYRTQSPRPRNYI